MSNGSRNLLVLLGLLGIVLIGAGTAFLPSYWITLALGLASMLFVLLRPQVGLYLLIAALYYPLLPNVPFGTLTITPTSILVAGLFLGTLLQQRRNTSLRLAGWQAGLLAVLGIVFIVTTLFSDSIRSSLSFAPNLFVYWMLLYIFMVLVRTDSQLWSLARWILILAFLLSLWRVELRPLRTIFGLPSMGINGAVFAFHPAVAVTLVILVLFPGGMIPKTWRFFSAIALFSMIYHGLLYQTRAGWLAWIIILAILMLWTRGGTRLAYAGLTAVLILSSLLFFSEEVRKNLEQTELTLQAAQGQIAYAQASTDDVIRLVARDTGLRLFYERPILGWGTGAYVRLKPSYVFYTGKEANFPGAFNSWLIALVEWGVLGTLPTILIFLLPIPISLRAIRRERSRSTMLAFAFSLGLLALSIHLLFVDLFYSFTWAHAGIALASARLAWEQVNA